MLMGSFHCLPHGYSLKFSVCLDEFSNFKIHKRIRSHCLNLKYMHDLSYNNSILDLRVFSKLCNIVFCYIVT